MYSWFLKAQDPMSSYTHFIGAVLAIPFAVCLLIVSILNQRPIYLIVAMISFTISMLALYSASCYYHYLPKEHPKKIMSRKLDHSMIYVLIAGSYTPVCAAFLSGTTKVMFLSFIWSIALIGIIAKIKWLHAPRWLYTLLYLLMGWALVFDIKGFSSMPAGCLTWIAIGGALYTIGAIIYIIKRPNLSKLWGFHELFHLFILFGTISHFIAILVYIA